MHKKRYTAKISLNGETLNVPRRSAQDEDVCFHQFYSPLYFKVYLVQRGLQHGWEETKLCSLTNSMAAFVENVPRSIFKKLVELFYEFNKIAGY
jgi:hypothetical protein